jgi:hypothetical protein
VIQPNCAHDDLGRKPVTKVRVGWTLHAAQSPNPGDKQELLLSSTAALTALTVSPNAGQTIDAAPTALAANGAVRFKYLAATTQWVRLIMA